MEANAAKVDAAKAAAAASDAAAALEKAESAHAAWQAKQPADAAAWEAVGKEGVQKGIDYYIKTFNQSKGDMYKYKKALFAASVFDPLLVNDMSELQVEELVDGLSHFGFKQFDNQFLVKLKGEVPTLIQHAQLPFDWSRVEGAAEYDKQEAAEAARESREARSWMGDVSERARRIWEWWRIKITPPNVNTFLY